MRALLVLAILVTFAVPSYAVKPVVIGVVYNLTGTMASIDVPGLEGMKLAVERVNRSGGVLGRPLALEVRDGASDPERCRDAAKELTQAGVSAIAGLNDSDFALVAGEVATHARIPFVTAGATLPTLPRMLGPYYFMTCFGDDAQGKAVAKFVLRRKNIQSMFVLTDRDFAFTTALAGYFTKGYVARGGDIPARQHFSAASTNPLGGALPACLTTGICQAVFVSGVPEDLVPSVTALRAAGYAGPIFSGDGFDTPLLSQLGDKAASGIFFSTHVSYDSPRQEVRRFVADWKALCGSEPDNGFAALGYDTVGLIADAVRRAKSSEPAQVRRALSATRKYSGVTGDISYTEPLSPPLKPVIMVRFENGKRVFEAEVLP